MVDPNKVAITSEAISVAAAGKVESCNRLT